MTAIERHRAAPVAPVTGVQAPSIPDGVAAIRVWAETAQAAGSLVEQLVDSPFIPDSFRPRLDPRASVEERARARQVAVATATAAVLYGGEIGLSPMQALNNVIVIHGRPSLYAETMVALVQAAGHEIWTESESDDRVVVLGRRAGSSKVERGEFTIERARQAGYLRNEKYKTDPRSMLYARAASIACRRTAPEVLKGIPTVEEVVDDPGSTRQAPPLPPAAPPPPVTAAEITGGPNPPAPVDEPAGSVPMSEPTRSPAATRAQLTKLHTIFSGHGVEDRAERLDICSRLIGRPLTTTNDLTRDDANTIIDQLEALASTGQDFSEFLAELINATEMAAEPGQPA